MYAKCGVRNPTFETLKYLKFMQDQGFAPNAISFCSIWKVCWSIGSITVAEKVQKESSKQGLLENNVVLNGMTLFDKYDKCGLRVLPGTSNMVWAMELLRKCKMRVSHSEVSCL